MHVRDSAASCARNRRETANADGTSEAAAARKSAHKSSVRYVSDSRCDRWKADGDGKERVREFGKCSKIELEEEAGASSQIPSRRLDLARFCLATVFHALGAVIIGN